MLIIISDLHLTDGSSSSTIDERAFRIFRHRLADLAYDASWRVDGRYKPLESLDIILLGDILDPIRSARWPDEQEGSPDFVRPWDDPQSGRFVEKVNTINQAILDFNAGSLDILKTLKNVISIPPATSAGRPESVGLAYDSPGRVPLDVRLHYMVGDRDWPFHLPGKAYDKIRQKVIEAMGLANQIGEPFPHEPAESAIISTVLDAHQVFARHGDIFDPLNYEGDRNASSLGDALQVELLSRFPPELRRRFDDEIPNSLLDSIEEIQNVQPSRHIPLWLEGVLKRTLSDPALMQKIRDVWNELVDNFLSLPYVRARDSMSLFESVDTLAWTFKLREENSFPSIVEMINWIRAKKRGSGTASVRTSTSYYRAALSEPAFQEKTARYIVHGHTHQYEVAPLAASNDGSQVHEQVYANTGTWRRVHRLAEANPLEPNFIEFNEISYLAFFRDDERGGRSFEAWSGTLH